MTKRREVTYDGSTYKVRSDKIALPDFTQMARIEVLVWLNRHTYARGYSRASNLLQGIGESIQLRYTSS